MRRNVILGTAAAAAILAIYLLRMNDAAGLMVDDAWYVLFAKALAEGNGYRMISSATTPMLPLYPPGFSAVLSLAFLVNPQFPDNVWLLKSVSIAAMMGVGLLSHVYFRRQRHLPQEQALAAAIAVTITPAFVFLATSSVMSECLFTLAQLAGVVLVHRSVDDSDPLRGRLLTVSAGIVAAATVLIRTAGVGLVLAAVLWLVKERRWKQTALFVAVVGGCLAPWFIYAKVNAPTREERFAHGGAVSYDYTEQVGMRWAGSPAFGRITLSEIPARLGNNVVDIFGRAVGGIVGPALLRGPAESGEELVALGGRAGLAVGSMGGAIATMLISFVLSGVVMVGYVQKVRERLTVAEILVATSLAITVVWPFWTFRFVLPLTPFILLYLLAGLQTLARGSARVPRLAILSLVGFHLYDHAGYIALAKGTGDPGRIQWHADARNVDETMEWIRTRLGEGILASTNPALVYLRTGRKGIALDDPMAGTRALEERGAHYAASFVPTELPDPGRLEYSVLYRSAARLWIVQLR